MGIPVLVMGQSGAGKSTSLRNFEADEVGVFNVASKPLPFRKKLKLVDHANYSTIAGTLKANKLKRYVIDDSQYLLAFEQLARANEVGYKKYTDMGVNFCSLINLIINDTSPDTVVYLLHHTERDENGHVKAKTVGRLIDNWITLEGLFSIVLLATVDADGHWFVTQSDGTTTAKSPMEMLPPKMENDLKAVDDAIRAYYEF